jgi:hypothetical protein
MSVCVVIATERSVRIWNAFSGFAQLVRQGRVVGESGPFVLGREHPEAQNGFRVIATRAIHVDAAPASLTELATQPGDQLLVVDHGVVSRTDWFPVPTEWPERLTAEALGELAMRAQAAAPSNRGSASLKPFWGVCAVLSW